MSELEWIYSKNGNLWTKSDDYLLVIFQDKKTSRYKYLIENTETGDKAFSESSWETEVEARDQAELALEGYV